MKQRQQKPVYNKNLSKELNTLVRKMQNPRARAAVKSISTVTTEELGRAAAKYRENEESNHK